jgi:DNA/RNA endonuclease YhcR with UshA esterase domain
MVVDMKKMMTGWLTVLMALVSTGPALAHHSLANADITKAVRVKGTIVQFHPINPHSIIYLEERSADGQVHRWAVEGPPGSQLARRGLENVVKLGDVIEVCGYVPKEPLMWQIQSADPKAVSLSGRLITAELLVMPDGHEQSWGDYGVHKCFASDFRDQHSK